MSNDNPLNPALYDARLNDRLDAFQISLLTEGVPDAQARRDAGFNVHPFDGRILYTKKRQFAKVGGTDEP